MSKIFPPTQHSLNVGFALRLVVALLLLQLLLPAPVLVTLGRPQTITTAYPQLGIHTRLTDEVEEWKIKRSLELVREMGAPWIVELFPWAYYEPQNDSFDWSHPDMVIDHATTQGLTVIARLGLVPGWARPADTPLNYLDSDAYADFADYAATFAARYRGRVNHIIVLNEPNLTFEWGGRPTTPADYVELLKVVYPAIKAVNPDAIVLAGALAPTLEPEGSPNGLNDLIYLEQLYAAGAAEWFDALAAHTYGLSFPMSADPNPELLNYRRVELLRDIMLKYGDERPVYITESGWNDHPRWTHAVRPAQRIQNSAEALQYAADNWPWVEVLGFWMLRTPAPTHSFLDYYTFITPEFIEKPIYQRLKEMTQGEP